MKRSHWLLLCAFPFICLSQSIFVAPPAKYASVANVANDFKALLRRPQVNFNPSFQTFSTDTVLIEKGFIYSEEKERVPVLIYKPVTPGVQSFPAVICLHGTGGTKDSESITDLLYSMTKIGVMAIAIDARFHGERIQGGARNSQQYVKAITKAWGDTSHTQQLHPLYFDTVYDIWRLTDYLITRQDVLANRLGMMGISMGGIETWMAASIDKRIKVIVPVIAVQSFKWSLDNNQWQGRANSIAGAHQLAANDLGDSIVNKENVKQLWNKLLPGITNKFDCPSMIRLFSPRPLLILNNENDLNCPLEGAQLAFASARKAYKSVNALNKLRVYITPHQPHRFLPEHSQMAVAWFKKWL